MDLEKHVRERLATDGPDGAATALIELLGPAILRYLRSMLRVEDASDAFSIWAMNVWTGLPAFRGESSLETWAYQLAWNVAQNLGDEAWHRRWQQLATGQDSALDELRAALSEEDRSLLILPRGRKKPKKG